MKRSAILLCFLSLALPAGAADSSDDAGMTVVSELGRLNGQALACSRAEAVAGIKALMIKLAPKSRRYGEAFESATNEGFLAQSREEQATCPDDAALAGQVDEVAKRLQTAFPVAVPQ
jgi:microcompartment protein CcmK/EutM